MPFYSTITAYNRARGLPDPQHPHLFLYSSRHQSTCDTHDSKAISVGFYSIFLKHVISGTLNYGRTQYDCDNGTMIFLAPHQHIAAQNISYESDVLMLTFHEDFLAQHPLRNKIRECAFFSYALHEALHLTPQEENIMKNLLNTMHIEYESHFDAHSQNILLAHLDTLLKYAERFYDRQFAHRKPLSGEVISRFYHLLQHKNQSGALTYEGLPNVDSLAKSLNMSARYLSETLKKETGRTALEHLHDFIIQEAKNYLLSPELSIQDVSDKLGFEYTQYFSRLFKKKVGLSPLAYRQSKQA